MSFFTQGKLLENCVHNTIYACTLCNNSYTHTRYYVVINSGFSSYCFVVLRKTETELLCLENLLVKLWKSRKWKLSIVEKHQYFSCKKGSALMVFFCSAAVIWFIHIYIHTTIKLRYRNSTKGKWEKYPLNNWVCILYIVYIVPQIWYNGRVLLLWAIFAAAHHTISRICIMYAQLKCESFSHRRVMLKKWSTMEKGSNRKKSFSYQSYIIEVVVYLLAAKYA